MKPIEKVFLARNKNRATANKFIGNIFKNFTELHGDRNFCDDKAIVGGIGMLLSMPVTVIGLEKGSNTNEKIARNFGSAHPEGYRKALRLMKQAEKFNRPIVCFVDTAGAFCGIGAEERGQGQAIADIISEMSAMKVPIISIFIGEGGSGGALALGVANEVWMLENAVYSVISPEGCASILYKDVKKADVAAKNLKLTAIDLFKLGIVEKIIKESETRMYTAIQNQLFTTLTALLKLDATDLVEQRYMKFRRIGMINADLPI